MRHPRSIVVIGSINMDLVCRTPRLPGRGETVLGSGLLALPGGKGANQAVAAAKLGGDVHMIGRVGDDDFGPRLLDGLRDHGVHTEHVAVTADSPSGCALILVDAAGENSIVVSPGANALLSPQDVESARDLIASAAVVVLQLEIPLKTVCHTVQLCHAAGVFTILDPAPAPTGGLPRELYEVDILTPNETEAQHLLADAPHMPAGPFGDAEALGRMLLSRGPRSVVLKLGGNGSAVVSGEAPMLAVAPFEVNVVDTTAAGDTFTGALAVGIAEAMPLPDAVRFANAAGALCCEKRGAQPALPTRAAVEGLLRRNNSPPRPRRAALP